jgi:hypothetical protein
MNDFEVMPPGSGRVLRQALQQLERGFAVAQQEQCADESDCTHMPWCRIRKSCQRAAGAQQEQEPGVCGRCGGLVYDPVVEQQEPEHSPQCALLKIPSGDCDCRQKQAPVAWRFRTAGIEHGAWRLTDDAGLVEQMRKLGHWDIRPLGELAAEGGNK